MPTQTCRLPKSLVVKPGKGHSGTRSPQEPSESLSLSLLWLSTWKTFETGLPLAQPCGASGLVWNQTENLDPGTWCWRCHPSVVRRE